MSYDESLLALISQDESTIKVWEMKTGNLTTSIPIRVPQLTCGCVSPSGKYLIGGSATGEINIWELNSGKIILTYKDYPNYINCVSWSTDERYVFAGFYNGSILALRPFQQK